MTQNQRQTKYHQRSLCFELVTHGGSVSQHFLTHKCNGLTRSVYLLKMLQPQVIMRVFGALVILLAFTFFSAACYAAYQAPKWSGKPRREQRNYGDRLFFWCMFFSTVFELFSGLANTTLDQHKTATKRPRKDHHLGKLFCG